MNEKNNNWAKTSAILAYKGIQSLNDGGFEKWKSSTKLVKNQSSSPPQPPVLWYPREYLVSNWGIKVIHFHKRIAIDLYRLKSATRKVSV